MAKNHVCVMFIKESAVNFHWYTDIYWCTWQVGWTILQRDCFL